MEIKLTHSRHLGPRCESASGKFRIESYHHFAVLLEDKSIKIPIEYIVGTVQGLTEGFGGFKVKVSILELEEHPVDSCQIAFQLLGRKVANEFFERSKNEKS